MSEIPMTSLSASVSKSCLFQITDKVSYFSWHDSNPTRLPRSQDYPNQNSHDFMITEINR